MRRPKLVPRKQPLQDRSRATVDAIVEAATYILVRDGYAKLTTNRVAERAGVNIASLYQYFPSKEAILAEIQRRHLAEQRQAMCEALEAQRGQDLESTIRALVSIGTAAHAVAPQVHAALTQALPVRRSRATDETDPVMREAARSLVGALPSGADRALILWIIATVSHAVIHAAALERSADLASGRVGTELIRLLIAYLRAPNDRGLTDSSVPRHR
jgi:AcrR family transcriptional regulator